MRTTLQTLYERIDAALAEGRHMIVAIDGRCGSGKTSLAEDLRCRYGCNVLHMDDFYLRPEQRTPARYAEPGGNVDRERFAAEVLRPLKAGRDFVYRPFDCRVMALGKPRAVQATPLTVVEGSYSCHSALRVSYDLRVFLTIDRRTQLKRLREREGEERLQGFVERWIPLEESYFAACAVEQNCELVLDGAALTL